MRSRNAKEPISESMTCPASTGTSSGPVLKQSHDAGAPILQVVRRFHTTSWRSAGPPNRINDLHRVSRHVVRTPSDVAVRPNQDQRGLVEIPDWRLGDVKHRQGHATSERCSEVLHPKIGFRMFWLQDPNLQEVVFRAYNDWMVDYVSHNPKRLVGIALISLYDIAAGCTELRRAAKAGLKGAMIALSPPEGCPPYNSPLYHPFWELAQELEMPLVLHIVTGGGESRLLGSYWNPDTIIGAVISHAEAEAAHETQALRPQCGLRVARLLGPSQGQSHGDAASLMLFHERGEVHQRSTGAAKLEAQASAQREVVLDRLDQRLHCAAPGHGKANVCNAARSTLA